MTKLVKGENLTLYQIKQVKAQYIYRLTVENNYPKKNPCGATVPPTTDAEWVKAHAFYINKRGDLSQQHGFCEPAFMADTEK